MLLTPYFLVEFGPSVAFGVPGLLMILATILFFFGRNTFTQIEPTKNPTVYFNEIKTLFPVLRNLSVIYLFISVFWSLFDQTGSTFIKQANSEFMVKTVTFLNLKLNILPSQIQSLNPILILIFVPLFSFVIYPLWEKMAKRTILPLEKIIVGLFITTFSFLALVIIQYNLDQKIEISILWQMIPYCILTIAEVMVSVTALEFSYTQAPLKMKSLIMSFYLLSVSFGNLITAFINWFIVDEKGEVMLNDTNYFLLFTILMLITSLLFVPIARKYKPKNFIRG